jgi:hypothetical protein
MSTHRGDDNGSLGRVVTQRPWLNPLGTQFAHTTDPLICASGQVRHANDLVLDVEELIAGERECWTLPLELEHDQTVVMAYMSAIVEVVLM